MVVADVVMAVVVVGEAAVTVVAVAEEDVAKAIVGPHVVTNPLNRKSNTSVPMKIGALFFDRSCPGITALPHNSSHGKFHRW